MKGIRIWIKNVTSEVSEMIIKAECKKWGLNYHDLDDIERNFIIQEIKKGNKR